MHDDEDAMYGNQDRLQGSTKLVLKREKSNSYLKMKQKCNIISHVQHNKGGVFEKSFEIFWRNKM
jgi:hypothetical protein